MCFGGGNSGARAAAEEARLAREAEEERRAQTAAAISRVNSSFDRQFTPDFFDGIQQNFLDYAMPQLDEQFGDASRDLTFDLARSGLGNSSVRSEQAGRLQRLYDRNQQMLTSQGADQANQARAQVEGMRGDLVSRAAATGSAAGAADIALSRANALSQPTGFSPIGQLFQDFTAGLGTQAAMERSQALSGGRFQAPYNIGLFGPSSDAMRNQR